MTYSQNDPRWKQITIGFDSGTNDTIGKYGCYLTAIANVCEWAGHSFTPQEINDLAKHNGWFVDGDLINRDDIPALLCSNLGYVGRKNWPGPVDMSYFDDASEPNVAYIIKIDASPADGVQTHFTMVYGESGNDLYIDDSWDGARKLLSHYGTPSGVIYSAMKFVKVAPAPAAAPAYAVVPEATPRHLQLVRATNKWDCNRTDFEDRRTHPIGEFPAGYDFIATAVYTTQDGNQYFSDDAQNSGGFHIGDCTDYVAPEPMVVRPQLPAAPIKGTQAQRYTLVTTVMTFPTANDARFGTNAQTTLRPGKYYVWDKQDKFYQLGTDNSHEPVGNWINTKYNVRDEPKSVEEPKPTAPIRVVLPSEVKVGTDNDTAWKSTYKPFYPDGRADKYRALQDITFLDYGGKRGKDTIPEGQELAIPGSFVKDGVTFYRPRSGRDEYFSWFYGIPMYDDYGKPNLIKVNSVVEEMQSQMELTLRDLPRIWIDDIRRVLTKKGLK